MNNLGRGATQKMIDEWWGEIQDVTFCECGEVATDICTNCGEHICDEHSGRFTQYSRRCLDCLRDWGGIDE